MGQHEGLVGGLVGFKIKQSDVVRAFRELRRAARAYTQATLNGSIETHHEDELHEAAMRYAHLVNKVARAGRS